MKKMVIVSDDTYSNYHAGLTEKRVTFCMKAQTLLAAAFAIKVQESSLGEGKLLQKYGLAATTMVPFKRADQDRDMYYSNVEKLAQVLGMNSAEELIQGLEAQSTKSLPTVVTDVQVIPATQQKIYAIGLGTLILNGGKNRIVLQDKVDAQIRKGPNGETIVDLA